MLKINDQNSNITETWASGPQISETFVARGIDDQKSWDINLGWEMIFAFINFQN